MEPINQFSQNNFMNIFVDLNLTVVLNIFLYSASATFGISIAIKIVDELIKHIRFRYDISYKNKSKQISELSRKMFDRLVDFEDLLRSGKFPSNNLCRRLRYNASRLQKYDKTISEDVDKLVDTWNLNLVYEKEGVKKPDTKIIDEMFSLTKKIKNKINKL